jgi:pimeloyl-ACP methyl ester carboxylesterase
VLADRSRADGRESAERFTLDDLPRCSAGLLLGDVVAAGTPILLVHGWSTTGSVFTLLRRTLRRRGFGRVIPSTTARSRRTCAPPRPRLARVVEQTCEETGYERVHVVGHSSAGSSRATTSAPVS